MGKAKNFRMGTDKIDFNEKMIGKTVAIEDRDNNFIGLVESVIDEERLRIRNIKTQETFIASIYDIRAV
tara:strand:+ start:3226 stop:3432 length:207 start_codon:yes stop_codon:yes gene_type:complete